MTDVKFTLRMLRRSPGFALSAIFAAALGIGATTAIFSIIDGVLLRPLPFPDPDRLVNVWEGAPHRNTPRMVVAPGNYYDWRTQNQVFSAIGAYQGSTFNLSTGEGEPERYIGAICDPDFFAVLRVSPALGRLFTEQENRPDQNNLLILGYNLWQQRFGGDPSIIGRNLLIDGRQRTVIAVMPRGFEYPPQATMWSPFGFDDAARRRRDFHRLRVIARLKDGVSLARARADAQTLGTRLEQQYPDLNQGEIIVVNPMLEDVVGTIRPALLVLLGAVGFVLLIACANVANLLLAKASGRQREIAIRTSLGAGRGAILRQMLVESVILALCGGALGLLMAYGQFRWLIAAAPANVPRLDQVGLNAGVAGVALLLSLLTGILFGLAPAWHASRIDVNSLLKEGMRGTSARSPIRNVLVVAQVAITLMLLCGAGLLMRSFYELAHVDAGFDPQHLMTMRLSPAAFKYRGHAELQVELARNIIRAVKAIPGVTSVGLSSDVPLLGGPRYIMRFEGRPPVTVSQAPVVGYFAVTPGFFEAMGMRLVRGRGISDRDVRGTPQVVVINQTLADRYFPGQDPIGKRLEIAFDDPPNWREIVGIVKDVKSAGLDQDTPTQAFTAFLQDPHFINPVPPGVSVLARTAGDPQAVASAMRSAILSVDRAQPVYAVQPMTDVVAQSIAQRRLSMILLAFFAVSGLVLAAVGVYGVMSYVVTQRTSEIGLRMALGAPQWQVLLQVQGQGMLLVGAGLVLGLLGTLAATRFMSSLLFRVGARDPLTFGLAAGVLILVAVAACYLPARRASRVDPIIALRGE